MLGLLADIELGVVIIPRVGYPRKALIFWEKKFLKRGIVSFWHCVAPLTVQVMVVSVLK